VVALSKAADLRGWAVWRLDLVKAHYDPPVVIEPPTNRLSGAASRCGGLVAGFRKGSTMTGFLAGLLVGLALGAFLMCFGLVLSYLLSKPSGLLDTYQ